MGRKASKVDESYLRDVGWKRTADSIGGKWLMKGMAWEDQKSTEEAVAFQRYKDGNLGRLIREYLILYRMDPNPSAESMRLMVEHFRDR